jgi:ribulose 1,5-bisphosphate synthetase/thiazole synthase
MPPKRKRTQTQKPAAGGGAARKRMKPSAMLNLAKKVVAQQLNRNIETKRSCHTDATENMLHNTIRVIDSGLFHTTQGVADPNDVVTLPTIFVCL